MNIYYNGYYYNLMLVLLNMLLSVLNTSIYPINKGGLYEVRWICMLHLGNLILEYPLVTQNKTSIAFQEILEFFIISKKTGVRLNYATTHHNPPRRTTIHPHPPPPTTSQNISTTTHYHPPPAKIHPPLPTISQKMDHHPAKAKICSYITSFWHCINSFFPSKCNIAFRDGDFVWQSFDQFVLQVPNFYLHSETATRGVL